MDTSIEEMLRPYMAVSLTARKNAMKEIIQEVILSGLYRAGFFECSAFYGGTALRIFHGLPRFSEDLDFSLAVPDPDFSFSPFLSVVETEVRSYGLNMTMESREKSVHSRIAAAMAKESVRELFLYFYPDSDMAGRVPSNELLKIKLEVDTDPPLGAGYERKYRLLPSPYEVNLFDPPSMFAGKLHAVIARAWRSRTKGRDLYDYVFYLSRKVPLNIDHLRERLIASGTIGRTDPFSTAIMKEMLYERFRSIDFEEAKQDVLPFIADPVELSLWSSEFFISLTGDSAF